MKLILSDTPLNISSEISNGIKYIDLSELKIEPSSEPV